MKRNLSLTGLTVAMLALSACANGGDLNHVAPRTNTTGTYTVDPMLAPYKVRFEELASDLFDQTYDTTNLTMKFGEVDDDETIAICNIYYVGEYDVENVTRREIIVNMDYWGASDAAKDNFMIHELGHCLNFRAHDTTEVSFPMEGRNAPSSIMYPNPIAMMAGLGPGFYNRNFEYYISELFNTNTYGSIFNNDPVNSIQSETMKRSYAIKIDGCHEETKVILTPTEESQEK